MLGWPELVSWQVLENVENRWLTKENQGAVIIRRVTGQKKRMCTTGEQVPTENPFTTACQHLTWAGPTSSPSGKGVEDFKEEGDNNFS